MRSDLLELACDQPAPGRQDVVAVQVVGVGEARRRVIDALDAQSEPLTRELRAYGRRQPGCRALMRTTASARWPR